MNRQRFDAYCLRVALESASISNDPSTKVGAVIARNGEIISTGWNRFPRGIEELPSRMADRPTKLSLILHAEQMAIISAGHRAEGGTLYVAAHDAVTGEVWGGPPCTRCLVETIEAGIVHLVSFPLCGPQSRWHADLLKSLAYAQEAGLHYSEISMQAARGITCTDGACSGGATPEQRPDAEPSLASGRSLANHPLGCK